MKLTLIITTYNWPEALYLVIESVKKQTIAPDEVIIADDGSSNETKKLIDDAIKDAPFNLIHSWQEDVGFRAARSRNLAILRSSGDYIIIIDGDTILHKNFIRDHIFNAEFGFFIQGSRVMLSRLQTMKKLTENNINFSFFSKGLHNRKNSIHSNILSKIFSTKNKNINGIKSCNMSFYRQDFYNVNGFNNDFEGWGREDSEFIVRLMNSGIKRKNVRFNALQFHLWHKENNKSSILKNDQILELAINKNTRWCMNGINSIEL